MDVSYNTAFGMSLCSAVFQLTASGPRKEWNHGSGRSATMQMAVSGSRQAVGKVGRENKTLSKTKKQQQGFCSFSEIHREVKGTTRYIEMPSIQCPDLGSLGCTHVGPNLGVCHTPLP